MQVAGNIDFTIIEHGDERVVGEMPIQPGILNPFGVTHAGALLWFADVCATILAGGTTRFAPRAGGFPLGISLTAHFTANQSTGTVRATSTFVKRGRRLIVVRTLIAGESGKLIADVTTSHVPAQPPSTERSGGAV